MKITKIKPQKRKKRVNIYLDGQFAFGLDAENFLKAGLQVGQKLTEKEIEQLIFQNEFQKLLDRALRLISFRPRSEKEIQNYLYQKLSLGSAIKTKKKKQLIEAVIKKLKKLRLLDDEQFTRWWLEQRANFRPRGKLGLKAELRQKGIAPNLIEKWVKEIDEIALAKKALAKKMKVWRGLNPEERRQKITAFLNRCGFSWEVVRSLLEDKTDF